MIVLKTMQQCQEKDNNRFLSYLHELSSIRSTKSNISVWFMYAYLQLAVFDGDLDLKCPLSVSFTQRRNAR